MSIDPLTKSYPWYTPYQFAGNKPIWAIDIDGLEEYYYYFALNEQGKPKFKCDAVSCELPYKQVFILLHKKEEFHFETEEDIFEFSNLIRPKGKGGHLGISSLRNLESEINSKQLLPGTSMSLEGTMKFENVAEVKIVAKHGTGGDIALKGRVKPFGAFFNSKSAGDKIALEGSVSLLSGKTKNRSIMKLDASNLIQGHIPVGWTGEVHLYHDSDGNSIVEFRSIASGQYLKSKLGIERIFFQNLTDQSHGETMNLFLEFKFNDSSSIKFKVDKDALLETTKEVFEGNTFIRALEAKEKERRDFLKNRQ